MLYQLSYIPNICKWFPHKDLNLDTKNQNLVCYLYTIGELNIKGIRLLGLGYVLIR